MKKEDVYKSLGFSKREQEVADLLLQGKSNKQIALAIGTSPWPRLNFT